MSDLVTPSTPASVSPSSPAETEAPPRVLTPAAQRALAEADERRRARDAAAAADLTRRSEIGGPSGPEPVRYGDWEKGGIAWDF